MKILYLANVRMPTEKAHGIQIMKTCEALAGQGVQVELIVPARYTAVVDDPFVFYRVQKKFTITVLPCWDLVSRNFFGAFGFWLESWTFYRSIKKYYTLIKKDTILYTRDVALAYWFSKKTSDLYYEIHTIPEKINQWHLSAWQRAKGLVVISNGLKEELMRHGVAQEKIVVAHDAVDLAEFSVPETKLACREKLNLPQDKKIVVYTGHLYEWKGAHVLAEAAKNLTPNVVVYLVGGTEADIHKFKLQYQIPNLHLVGFRPHHEMVYWQKAADLLVLPTSAKTPVGAKYTSPLKLFEYLASGTPIIASDSPAMREILTNENAVLIKPDSVEALQNAILDLLQSPSKYANLGANAGRISHVFSWGNRAKLIADFVEYHGKKP